MWVLRYSGPWPADRRRDRSAASSKEKSPKSVSAVSRALLLCPLTYMNRSGLSVRAACNFYKLPVQQLLVVCDDFQLPLGKLRFRPSGSAGGQKGLADIIQRLGSDQFARLRIGIGKPPDAWDPADYVLSRFRDDERPTIEASIQQATQGVVDWMTQGIEHCMNHYNGS